MMENMDADTRPAGFASPPFADAVAASAAARPIDRLVAYTGRTP
jgi:hypothetical protein